MSLLAISVQHYCTAQIVKEVKATNFWPVPEVDSAIIKLEIKPNKFSPAEDKQFFRLAKVGFSAKRKMLKNNLQGGLILDAKKIEEAMVSTGLNISVRAEQLSLEDWYKLFAQLSEFMV